MPFQNSIVGGGGSLVRSLIKSPNFVHNVSGWTINKDGSAEFNNLTIRGTFNGTNYIINTNGAFFYNGTPGPTTLSISICPVATTSDPFGTACPRGITTFGGNYTLTSTMVDAGIVLTKLSGAFAPPSYQATDNVLGNSAVLSTTRVGFTIAASASILTSIVTGDTNDRFDISESGVHSWGPGNTASDTTLFRAGPQTIGADNIFFNNGGGAVDTLHAINISPGYVNGWADGGRVPGKYNLIASPPKCVNFVGSLLVPAGVVAGQNITAAFPTAYQPTNTQAITAINITNNLPVRLTYGTNGIWQFSGPVGNVAAGNVIDWNAIIRLSA